MRFILLLVLLLISLCDAIAQSSSLSSSSSSQPTKQNKCCFCVHPDKGERDHDEFKAVCESCLPRKFPDCDVTRTVPAMSFTPEFLKSFNCASPVNWINLQHGPYLGYVVNQVEVCRSAYPTCSISVSDLSCATYGDDAQAQKAIKFIQEGLGGKGQVTICGSVSNNLQKGCESIRVSKRYVISPDKVDEDIGRCQTPGSLCSPSGAEYSCKDTLERAWKQRCCKVEDLGRQGVWSSPGHECEGRGCSESTCPDIQACEGNTLIGQMCMVFEDTKTSFCLAQSVDCREKGKVCNQKGPNKASCVWPNPSPTATQAK